MVLCHNVYTIGQIPTACADEDSLENLRCCPTTDDGVCGEDANRGQCVQLSIDGYRIQIQLICVPTGPTTLNILL